MDSITASIAISRDRQQVFDYLYDLANHPEFSDHLLTEWHLARIDSKGKGASGRFRYKLPFLRFAWGDITFIDISEPYELVGVGRMGKFNRIKTYWRWTLSPAAGGTHVEFEFDTQPVFVTDYIVEFFVSRRRVRRRFRKALHRLQTILESNEARGKRATIAGL